MSDKRTSLSPIIVGVVIALIGILTGLYIADNARSQLKESQQETVATEQDDDVDKSQATELTTFAPADELPAVIDDPLPPVVSDPLPTEAREADEQAVPAEELPVEPDDFEEVPLEELEAAGAAPTDSI